MIIALADCRSHVWSPVRRKDIGMDPGALERACAEVGVTSG